MPQTDVCCLLPLSKRPRLIILTRFHRPSTGRGFSYPGLISIWRPVSCLRPPQINMLLALCCHSLRVDAIQNNSSNKLLVIWYSNCGLAWLMKKSVLDRTRSGTRLLKNNWPWERSLGSSLPGRKTNVHQTCQSLAMGWCYTLVDVATPREFLNPVPAGTKLASQIVAQLVFARRCFLVRGLPCSHALRNTFCSLSACFHLIYYYYDLTVQARNGTHIEWQSVQCTCLPGRSAAARRHLPHHEKSASCAFVTCLHWQAFGSMQYAWVCSS